MKTNFLKPALTLVILVAFSFSAAAQKGKAKKTPKVLATGEVFKCDIEPKVENGIPNMLRVVASKRTDVAIRLLIRAADSTWRRLSAWQNAIRARRAHRIREKEHEL